MLYSIFYYASRPFRRAYKGTESLTDLLMSIIAAEAACTNEISSWLSKLPYDGFCIVMYAVNMFKKLLLYIAQLKFCYI